MLIKTNGKYGAKVGNQMVFTREGAVDVYKAFVEVCYRNMTQESAAVLSGVEGDMIRLGFTFEELEDIEISAIQEKAVTA